MSDWLKDLDRDVLLHYGQQHIFAEIYRTSDEAGQEAIVDLFSSVYRGRQHPLLDAAKSSSIYFDNHLQMAKGDPFHSLYMSYLAHRYLKDEYDRCKKDGGMSDKELGAQLAQRIDNDLEPALDAALDTHSQLLDVVRGDDPGNKVDRITDQDLNDLRKIAALCSDQQFSRIMRMMGSFWKSYQQRFRDEVFPSNTTPVDVQFGDNLSKMLTSELLGVVNPVLHRLFNLKLATKRLLEMRKEQRQDSERGPVYIALDISGSMHSGIEVEGFGLVPRYELAAALVLVIMRICYKEKRDFDFFLFGSSTRHSFSSATHPRLLDALQAVARQCKGNDGTEVLLMLKTLSLHKRKTQPKHEPDFLVISDLEDRCPESTVEALKPILGKTRCHALIVHANLDKQWSQVFTTLTATTNPADMTQFLVDSTKKVPN